MKWLLLFVMASALLAQNPPPISNADVEVRSYSGNLDTQLRSSAPTWFGYQIKTIRKDESCCWGDSNRGCWLEGDSGHRMSNVHSSGPIQLEGSDAGALLFRVENNRIQKIEMFSMSCPLDAGGLPFVWLTGVTPQASLSELRQMAVSSGNEHLMDGAVFAIAQHEESEADTVLNELAGVNQPEKLREKVAFWLGSSRGVSGVKTLQQMIKNDPSEGVREKVVFALSISKQPEGLDALISLAKNDPAAKVPQRRRDANKQNGREHGNSVFGEDIERVFFIKAEAEHEIFWKSIQVALMACLKAFVGMA